MYINSKKFSDELKKSFEQDRLTDKFVEMLLILVKKLSQHNKHLSTADVEDIQMCAIEVVLKNWKQFDFNKNDNGPSLEKMDTLVTKSKGNIE